MEWMLTGKIKYLSRWNLVMRENKFQNPIKTAILIICGPLYHFWMNRSCKNVNLKLRAYPMNWHNEFYKMMLKVAKSFAHFHIADWIDAIPIIYRIRFGANSCFCRNKKSHRVGVFLWDNFSTEMNHLIWMPPFHASCKKWFSAITLNINLQCNKTNG